MQNLAYLIRLLHSFDKAFAVVALNHSAQNLQLVNMLTQNIQDVVLVLQEDRSPGLRQALRQTHRTLKTSARKVEDMLLLALLL